MKTATKSFVTRALCGLLVLAAAGCAPRHHDEVLTVQDLLDDRVKLDGVLMKCNENAGRANGEGNCAAARIAAARVSNAHDQQKAAQRSEDFERRREELRMQQERQRQSQESQKPDPYHLPVVPVDPAPKAPATQDGPTAARN